jgi:hypothetical protein
VLEEWRSFGERCEMERELGAVYIGPGKEWRGAVEAVCGGMPAAAIDARWGLGGRPLQGEC